MTNRVKKYLLFMFGNWSTYQNNAKVVNNIREIKQLLLKRNFHLLPVITLL